MAFDITIPRLGWSMEEGTFVRWLKCDGDLIKPGDALYELEGEKSAQDIEAVDGGVLRIPPNAPSPGSIVAVGAVIGHLVAEGEPAPLEAAQDATGSALAASVRDCKHTGGPELTPVAPEIGAVVSPNSGLASAVASSSQPSQPSSQSDSIALPPVASPRARRIAAELGVDWTALRGSGRSGRVRERDVRAVATGSSLTPTRSRQSRDDEAQTANASIPLSTHRRTIAARMLASSQRTAPVTLTTRVDATNLVALRTQFKATATNAAATGQPRTPHPLPSYNDIVLKLVAGVLREHPLLAARREGDHYALPTSFDIGFAVDTDEGLVVLVVRNAAARSLIEVAAESSRLIELARTGRLTAAEMEHGVFTITNLGSFGIDAFTPIINYPEVAILGLGRIRTEAVVYEGQIVARDQLTLSLTFDHCLVDGAPAARFLQAVGQSLENPAASLLKDIRD